MPMVRSHDTYCYEYKKVIKMIEKHKCDIVSFDVKGVDSALRANAWTDALNDYLYGYDVEFPSDFTQAKFKGVAYGDFRAATISCDPMHTVRSTMHIAKSGRDGYLLMRPLQGQISFVQQNRDVTVQKGQFALISASEPYASFQHSALTSHIMFIPGAVMRHHKQNIDDYSAINFSASSMQTLFIDHALSICRNMLKLNADDMGLTVKIFLSTLVTLVECEESSHAQHRSNLYH